MAGKDTSGRERDPGGGTCRPKASRMKTNVSSKEVLNKLSEEDIPPMRSCPSDAATRFVLHKYLTLCPIFN